MIAALSAADQRRRRTDPVETATPRSSHFASLLPSNITITRSSPLLQAEQASQPLPLKKGARTPLTFERQSHRPNRGRCRTACQGKTLRERQQIGAHAAAAVKRQETLDNLVTAYQQLVDDGVVPWGSTPLNRFWAKQAEVAIRTVQKHRTALRAAIEAGDARR